MHNTFESPPSPPSGHPPRFPWPKLGPDSLQVTWAEFLKLTAAACETAYPGSPGRFIAAYLHALSAQAIALEAESPEAHETKAEAERLREAAYLRALEDQSGYWSITEPELDPCDDVTGSLDGHMDDSGPMQAWLGDPSHDDTYMN
jgi:hypothetical protein